MKRTASARIERLPVAGRPKVSIHDVVLAYERPGTRIEPTLALDRISCSLADREFVAIIGPSGCGKSTLLKVISGLIRPTAGHVEIDGEPVVGVPRTVGFLFQSDALLPWRTAGDNVRIGARLAGRGEAEAAEVARTLLEQMGLAKAAKKFPSELSGGMRKRVALARTLAYDPTVILLDEPFSALDAQTRIHVANRFLAVFEELKRSVIFVTHDIDEAVAMADRIIVMTAGPGRIAGDFRIDLPRPRDYYRSRMEPGFRDYQEQVWDVLRREMEGVLQ